MRVNASAFRSAGLMALFVSLSLSLSACASGPAPMSAPVMPGAESEAPTDPGAVAEVAVPEAAPAPEADPALDTVRAGAFDNGKMWTFEYPPLEYLRNTYGFSADTEWFQRAHLSALRIPGCTASFVSPNGLVMMHRFLRLPQRPRHDESPLCPGKHRAGE